MRRRHAMLWIMAAAAPLCAAAFWPTGGANDLAGADEALAQTSPTDAPSPGEASSPSQSPSQNSDFAPRRPLMEYLRWQFLSPQERQAQSQNEQLEWSKLLQFLKDNCPNRYLLVLRQSPRPNSPARMRLLMRWQNMVQSQRTQPELYDVHVQQFKQEDALIGLAAQFRQARNRRDGNRVAELREEIKQEAAKLIDLNLRQRLLTIQNAQALLDEEKETLNRDMANKGEISQQRAMQILQQVDRAR